MLYFQVSVCHSPVMAVARAVGGRTPSAHPNNFWDYHAIIVADIGKNGNAFIVLRATLSGRRTYPE